MDGDLVVLERREIEDALKAVREKRGGHRRRRGGEGFVYEGGEVVDLFELLGERAMGG